MRYEITIPYEDKNNTIEEDTSTLVSLGVTEVTHVLLDAWEIECTPEILVMILLSIAGSRVISTITDKT